jgi:hypothetical protein
VRVQLVRARYEVGARTGAARRGVDAVQGADEDARVLVERGGVFLDLLLAAS